MLIIKTGERGRGTEGGQHIWNNQDGRRPGSRRKWVSEAPQPVSSTHTGMHTVTVTG